MLHQRHLYTAIALLTPLLALTVACRDQPSASPPAAAAPARTLALTPLQAAYQLLDDLVLSPPPTDLPAGLHIINGGLTDDRDDIDRVTHVVGTTFVALAQGQQSELRYQSSDLPADGELRFRVFATPADARNHFDRAGELAAALVQVRGQFSLPASSYPATCITFTLGPLAGAGCIVLMDTVEVQTFRVQPGGEPRGAEDQAMELTRAGIAHIEALQAAAARRAATPPARPVLRLGWLAATDLWGSGPRGAFLRRMEALGYHRGQDFVLDYRFADGQRERLPALAVDLVADRVDQIVAADLAAAAAAQQATTTTPIVVLESRDPVAEGLATSVAHPGGNITGLIVQDPPEIYGKRLEILTDAFPGLARVAVVAQRFDRPGWDDLERVARARGVELIRVPMATAGHIDGALETITSSRAQAVLQFYDVADAFHASFKQYTLTQHVPFMEDGPIGEPIGYAGSPQARFQRAADLVDRIRGGVAPADLPFERPAVFHLKVDLLVARAWGLQIAPALVAQADEVRR